jgi:non-ribosomal peptide synthetase component F
MGISNFRHDRPAGKNQGIQDRTGRNRKSLINKKLEIRIPMVELFQNPSIRGLSQYIKKSAVDRYASIAAVEKRENYPLSSSQKRLFILQEMEPESVFYNMPEIFPLSFEPKVEQLQTTFQQLIHRHQGLRTSFHMVESQPVQEIHDTVEFEIEHHDAGRKAQSAERKEERQAPGARRFASTIKSFVRPFALTQAPLLRVGLLKTDRGQYVLMIDMHHIISDGVSHGVLVKDFTALNRGETLPPLRIQYKDFSQWQADEKETENLKNQERYWLKEFQDQLPILEMPLDFARPAVQSYEGTTAAFAGGSKEIAAIKRYARREGVTAFMVFLAIFNILLAKISHQEDIVIGTPVAGRRHADLEKIIGMFVNTLALRNFPQAGKTFVEFLPEVKKRTLTAFENQEYPFEDLVEKVVKSRDPARHPLFDVMLSIHEPEKQPQAAPPNANPPIPTTTVQYQNRISKFDLSLDVMVGEKLYFSVEYCSKLFKKSTIERFIGWFKNIMSAVLETPGKKIREIEIISPKEKKQILHDFCETTTPYEKDKTIRELFTEQAEKTPHQIALAGVHQTHEQHEKNYNMSDMSYMSHMSYKELNKKSHRLACLLIEKGVKPDTIVGIMLERSIEMIAGILGILKAGGAYLPLDPEYPEERIKYMLADSGAKVLLTAPDLALASEPPASTLTSTLTCQVSSTNLAYIIYTSGSTGRPKGVMVAHSNVMTYIRAFSREVEIRGSDVMLQQTSYSFDTFVEEVYPILCKGAKLAIPQSHEIKDIPLLTAFIIRHNVTIIDCSPLLLNELNKPDLRQHRLPLQTFISGGDVLKASYIDNLLKTGKVYNGYGPTETTVCITFYKCPSRMKSKVPIGNPWPIITRN